MLRKKASGKKIQTEAEKEFLSDGEVPSRRYRKTTRSWRRDRPRQRSFLMSFLSEGLAPEDDLMEEDLKVG